MQELKIEYLTLDKLKPYEKNAVGYKSDSGYRSAVRCGIEKSGE